MKIRSSSIFCSLCVAQSFCWVTRRNSRLCSAVNRKLTASSCCHCIAFHILPKALTNLLLRIWKTKFTLSCLWKFYSFKIQIFSNQQDKTSSCSIWYKTQKAVEWLNRMIYMDHYGSLDHNSQNSLAFATGLWIESITTIRQLLKPQTQRKLIKPTATVQVYTWTQQFDLSWQLCSRSGDQLWSSETGGVGQTSGDLAFCLVSSKGETHQQPIQRKGQVIIYMER